MGDIVPGAATAEEGERVRLLQTSTLAVSSSTVGLSDGAFSSHLPKSPMLVVYLKPRFFFPAVFWFSVALTLRIFIGIIIHYYSITVGFDGFYPLGSGHDDRYYWEAACSILEGNTPEALPNPYPYVLAVLFFLTGRSLLIGKLLNVIAGSLVVYYGVLIARELAVQSRYTYRDLRHPANLAGFFLTFYPSSVFYSTQLLRDSLLLLFGMLALYWGIRLVKGSQGLGCWIKFAIALLLLLAFRPYAALVLATSFVLYLILHRPRPLIVAGLLLVSAFLPQLLGLGWFGWDYIAPLADAERLSAFRKEVYSIGGSAAGVQLDFSSLPRFLGTYALSFLIVMFGPFVWQVRSASLAIGLVESLPMLFLLPLWLSGFWKLIRRRLGPAEFLFLFSLLLIGAIALFSDNIGANTRLRLLPWSAFLVYAAVLMGYGRRRA